MPARGAECYDLCIPQPFGALFTYEPGQFLTSELPLPQGIGHRTSAI